MARRYYSSRNQPASLSLEELYWKLQHLYLLFREGDHFKSKAGITGAVLPKKIQLAAARALDFQPFPITKWTGDDITEDHIFDVLEFLCDYVSKPGEWGLVTNNTGYNYNDYEDYDDEAGRAEFRDSANAFLVITARVMN